MDKAEYSLNDKILLLVAK